MLPAPASTAAPPRARSRASWNPAVPPPPVAGATVMNGLGDGLGDGLGVGDAGAVCVGDGDGLALGLGELLTVLLGEADDVGVAVRAGENEDETADGVAPEQAETAAEARMVMVLQPMTANLALCFGAALVERTFMKPPRTSPQVATAVPVPGTGAGRENATRPAPEPAEGRSPETAPAIKVRPADCADNR